MNGEPVTVAYTYRVLVQRHGHILYLDLPRSTKGLKVQFTYGDAGIRRVTTLDFIASAESARVEDAPASVPGRLVTIGFYGWIFPAVGGGVCVGVGGGDGGCRFHRGHPH